MAQYTKFSQLLFQIITVNLKSHKKNELLNTFAVEELV